MKLTTNFDGVARNDFRKIIQPLKSVVRFFEFAGIGAGGEIVEDEVLYSLSFGIERHNRWRPRRIDEALRCQANSDSALRFAEIVVRAHKTEVDFIHFGRTQRLRVAQAEKLRPA